MSVSRGGPGGWLENFEKCETCEYFVCIVIIINECFISLVGFYRGKRSHNVKVSESRLRR
jgi:hypothetical protein